MAQRIDREANIPEKRNPTLVRSTNTVSQQIWFITGSSRGFGRALVSAALDAGDSVVATARRPG
jgi:hypothetical protein